MEEASTPAQPTPRRGMIRALWAIGAGHRLIYFSAIASLIVASCLLYIAPMIPQAVIDGVLTGEIDEVPAFNRWLINLMGGVEYVASNLWAPAVIMIVITALAGAFTYLRGKLSAQASESIVRRVRDRVYDHLQHLPVRYYDRAETGDLLQRATSDVETLRVFLASQVVEIGRAVVMLLVPLPVMIAIDWRMTVASVVLLPVIVVFSVIFFGRVRTAFKHSDEAEAALTATIQENLTGIRVVRAFARQQFEEEKMDRRNAEYRRLEYRLFKLMSWYWSSSDVLCFAQKIIVVGIGAWLLSTGELGVGAFFYFLTAVNMFLWPVRMMGRILTDLGKATVALGRLREVLDEPEEDERERVETSESRHIETIAPRNATGALEFRDVSFSHGNSPVLHEVSFTIEPGKTVAILGPSGCGKSTIVNLLLRLYDHDAGEILVDGRPIESYDRKWLRGQMATVMQEPFLYSKTLRDNIALGRSNAKDDEIIEAAAVAAVHESIMQFDQQYDTLVGERGVTLSGGQRQRVALSRALLQRPAFMILDDAFSAVDTETESMILDAIRSRSGSQTTILIAHRLSTLMDADQILVMSRGRIIQRGTHDELVQQEGMYRRLWEIQTSEEDVEEVEEVV